MGAWAENETLMWWLAAVSAVMLVATLVLVPRMLVQLPADYFSNRAKSAQPPGGRRHPAWHLAQNILGYVLIVLGLLLLVLPGQGVLTLLAGVLLADFPGRQRLLRALVRRGAVLRFINRRRQKAGRKPLVL